MSDTPHAFHDDDTRPPFWGLPDPETQSEFYKDVILKRLLAWIIDVAIVFTLCFLLSLLTLGVGFFLWGFIYLAVSFVYRVTTLSNKSATLGMRLCAIEMRNHQGETFSRATAALHTVVYFISMSTFLLQLGSIVMMFTTPRGQGLGDMLMGSAVINRMAAR